MNLRHIDPRSTDWMDAMLEGESEGKRKRDVSGEGKREGAPQMVAAEQAATPPAMMNLPPPDGTR